MEIPHRFSGCDSVHRTPLRRVCRASAIGRCGPYQPNLGGGSAWYDARAIPRCSIRSRRVTPRSSELDGEIINHLQQNLRSTLLGARKATLQGRVVGSHLRSGPFRRASRALAGLREAVVAFVARVPARVETKLLVA